MSFICVVSATLEESHQSIGVSLAGKEAHQLRSTNFVDDSNFLYSFSVVRTSDEKLWELSCAAWKLALRSFAESIWWSRDVTTW